MREMAHPTAACAELVHSSIRPQFDMLLAILRELLPSDISAEQLRLTGFSIVGQCLFYHLADPVVRNLLTTKKYSELDVEKLARHILDFSLSSIGRHARGERKGAVR
jgi:TetR/AcrR family transcriptional regulator, regulator of cefoperazone and chloramphenicol sensitivity